jgi:Icc-related predicted phosphoesterase
MPSKAVRVAAVGDLHYGRSGQNPPNTWMSRIGEVADVLVLCGDLTDYGRPEEAQQLAQELKTSVRVPIVAVLGNHDFESDQADQVTTALRDIGVNVLDGDTCEVLGVGFAGVKGFAGGFGRGALGPWGERAVKVFVQEAVNESLKLESALARLRTRHKIAVLHYAPTAATVAGEPPEIYPYLGCSRLAEPLARYPVTAVFHGHAHNGSAEGVMGESPVYNVSLPLMTRLSADLPVRILTLAGE